MASIDITTQSGAVGNGDLQLQNGAPMDGTLRFVTDAVNTASPLKLSTSLVQTTSTLKITTNDNPYIDAEDGAGNNRFTVGRDTGSQQVNVDFASNPGGSTTIVGAIRTYVDGVNLSEVMAFREDGNVGIGTTSPGAKLDIHSASNVITQFNRTGAGKSWIQFQQAGTARWNTGYDNTNGNYTIYDAVNAADRMVVTNAGNVGIGTITPGTSLGGAYGLVLNSGAASDNQIRLQNNTTGSNSTDGGLLSISGSLLYLWNYEASDTIFGTNSAERMRITSTGNVGIGTSSPNFILETAGTTGIGVRSAGVDGVYTDILSSVYSGNNNEQNAIQASVSGVASDSGFRFQVSDGAGLTTQTLGYQMNKDRHIFYTNGSERIRITTDGLTFNGDTAAANALDDYEEGTFTATLTPSVSGSISLSVNTCTYTKIGRQVTIRSQIVVSSVSLPVGNLVILGGLPFLSLNSVSGRGLGCFQYFPAVGSGSILQNYQLQNSIEVNLILDASTIASGAEFYFSLTYFV